MSRFTGVTYDAERGMVEIGVGLTWDQVYEKLEPMGVMVAGGRTPGIGKSVPFCRMNIDLDTKVSEGVGGLSLGGGYSWKTNQYGLTVDTIVAHNIVLPSGQQIRVTNTSYPDLFFGLKVSISILPVFNRLPQFLCRVD